MRRPPNCKCALCTARKRNVMNAQLFPVFDAHIQSVFGQRPDHEDYTANGSENESVCKMTIKVQFYLCTGAFYAIILSFTHLITSKAQRTHCIHKRRHDPIENCHVGDDQRQHCQLLLLFSVGVHLHVYDSSIVTQQSLSPSSLVHWLQCTTV